MTNPEYTPEGLPVIKTKAYQAVRSCFLTEGGINDSSSKQIVKIIEKDNSAFSDIIGLVAESNNTEEFKAGFAAGVAITYELFRCQAANNLKNI